MEQHESITDEKQNKKDAEIKRRELHEDKTADQNTSNQNHQKMPSKELKIVIIEPEKVQSKEINSPLSAKDEILVNIYDMDINTKETYTKTTEDNPPTKILQPKFKVYLAESQNYEYQENFVSAEDDRRRFIQRVFMIVFVMLVCTAIITYLVYNSGALKSILRDRTVALFGSIGICVCMMVLSCVFIGVSFARQFPCNIVCLVITVLLMTTLLCIVTVKMQSSVILIAVLATAVVVLVCIALSFTSVDFTKFYLIVVAASVVIAVLGLGLFLVSIVMGQRFPLIHLIITFVSAIVSSVMMIIELQMILGGKSVEMDPDEYALGAFLIYNSVIDLLIKILHITNFFSN